MVAELTKPVIGDVEPVLDEVHGIWDKEEKSLFTQYRISAQFTGRVMGGVPQKAEAIEGWILRSLQGGDAELYQAMQETLDDIGVEADTDMSYEELKDAAKKVAAKQHGNTFRRDANGLFLADYQIKAMLKENVAILFPWNEKKNRMGATSKAAKAFWAERVFVDEARVYLGRDKPDGTYLQVGHVNGAQGARSTLTYYDYCEQPTITFTASSLQDMIKPEMWRDVFLAAQRNGLGALRSLGYGQFKVTTFDKL